MLALLSGGFVLGLLSTGHCAGMCGPLALFFSSTQVKPWIVWFWLGLGKALSYAMIGLITGCFGYFISQSFLALGAPKIFPWIAGISFILLAGGFFGWWPSLEVHSKKWEQILMRWFQPTGQGKSYERFFVLGVFWGFLPCPMVLASALGAAASSGIGASTTALNGFFFMFAFGVGTIPGLVMQAVLGRHLSQALGKKSRYVIGAAYLAMGIVSITLAASLPTHCH